MISKFGTEGWVEYLRDMAREYYRPVWHAWKAGGLDAVARYLVQSFEAEPDAVFAVRREKESVVLDVVECPAIKHLRKDGRIMFRNSASTVTSNIPRWPALPDSTCASKEEMVAVGKLFLRKPFLPKT